MTREADAGEASRPRVVVLADDLIWATRLREATARAGADVIAARTADGFVSALPGVAGAVVDLTARAYDGIAALEASRASGVPAVAVAQHDDAGGRAAARGAGAARVFAYAVLAQRGDAELGRWLRTLRDGPTPAR